MVQQWTTEGTTTRRNSGTMEDQSAPITSADYRDINSAA